MSDAIPSAASPICNNGHAMDPGESRCPSCGARLRMQWMSKSEDQASTPAGWYPELRYWDGSQWTESVSTVRTEPTGRQQPSRLLTFRVGWWLVCVGFLGAALGSVLALMAAGPTFDATFGDDPCSTPCTRVLQLDPGYHLVYEQIGEATYGRLSPMTVSPAKIAPKDVSVTSPTGRALRMSKPLTTETLDRNPFRFGGVVAFRVQNSGPHRVAVDAPAETRVMVAPDLIETMTRASPGVGVVLLFGIVPLSLGVFALLATWSRRGADESPQVGSSAGDTGTPRWVWVGLGSVVLTMLAWVMLVPPALGLLRSETNDPPELEVGQCLDDLTEGPRRAGVVPCEEPHRGEVFATFDLTAGPYPGESKAAELAGAGCKSRYKQFVGRDLESSKSLSQFFVWPTAGDWWKSRRVSCVVFAYNDVMGTLKGADR